MAKYILLFFCFISIGYAHPHTFIDVYIDIRGTELQIKWVFDEMTSTALLEDFDSDHNHIFDAKEVELFKKEVFNPLEKLSFFTNLKVAKKKITLSPKNIQLSQTGNSFVVEFCVDLKPYEHQKKSIGFWDESFLCALSLESAHIHSTSHYTLKEVDNTYYYGYLLELP